MAFKSVLYLLLNFGLMQWFFIGVTADSKETDNTVLAILRKGISIIEAGKRSIKFVLYNRPKSLTPINRKQLEDISPKTGFADYSKDLPTIFIIPGWLGKDSAYFCKTMRDDLLKVQNMNLIVVDWSNYGAMNVIYNQARKKVNYVAKHLAEFLDDFSNNYSIPLENIHVVGFSLGAHIGGIAGILVKNGRIGRITGLDPASPLFSIERPTERLSRASAIFVDVIHTCGKFLGLRSPLGHVDFYPNSGMFRQPGCGMDIGGTCSHMRAYFYYVESFKNRKAFPAVSCPDWKNFLKKTNCDLDNIVYMGEALNRSTRGIYYLETRKKPPYGLGKISE